MFPPEVVVSEEAEALVRGLCCEAEARLGRDGADAIRQHPFFAGTDWGAIRSRKSMIDPHVESIHDTKNFDEFPDEPVVGQSGWRCVWVGVCLGV